MAFVITRILGMIGFWLPHGIPIAIYTKIVPITRFSFSSLDRYMYIISLNNNRQIYTGSGGRRDIISPVY